MNLDKWELQCVRGKALDGINDWLDTAEEKIREFNDTKMKLSKMKKRKKKIFKTGTEHQCTVAQLQAV